jgi:hypothetical protein
MINLFKLINIIAVLILLSISSCKKDSPASIDFKAPSLRLTISGPGGVNEVFTDEGEFRSDFGSLNLMPSSNYSFTLSSNDTSGMGRLKLELTNDLAGELISGVPNMVNTSGARYHYYTASSTSEDPYTSMLISGRFTTPDAANGSIAFYLSAEARDFRPNISNLLVSTNIDNNPFGGFGWVSF